MSKAATAARLDAARTAISAVFMGAGYEPTEPPISAPAEIFLERLGERFRRRTCFFEDGAGEELCLRPEITIPVCRLVLDQGYQGERPLRLRYAGPVFRLAQDGTGPLVESAQAGAELLGDANTARAEAEIIALTISGLTAAGFGDARIVLGDVGAFTDLLHGLALTDRQRTHLVRLFDAYGSGLSDRLPPEAEPSAARVMDLDLALAETDEVLERRQLTLTGGRTVRDVAVRLADRAGRGQARAVPPAARTALSDFFTMAAPIEQAAETVATFFKPLGIATDTPNRLTALVEALGKRRIQPNRIVFDASVHAPLGYYTGIEFRAEARGRIVAGGGRYDALIGELASRPGLHVPAVGCAFFLDKMDEAWS